MTSTCRVLRVVAVSSLALGAAVAISAAGSASAGLLGGTVHYALERPVCAAPADPRAVRCFAIRRVPATAGTSGAIRYVTPNALPTGPAGGYTPADLATAYGYNPATPASTQTVALVDFYDAPTIASDLAHFDQNYGLAAETATSFRKVNQDGATSPLPNGTSTDAKDSSVEIALDVESVRAVCRTCNIMLVEANTPTDTDLATAENTAVRLGATEVSNSFGGPESPAPTAALQAAFNHPGVVITASTGDDGWYGWDFSNAAGGQSDGAAAYPATDPHVVAVGGTTLTLTGTGARADETVWNENGPHDSTKSSDLGATGGGCSTIFDAPAWQAAYPNYTSANCAGKRLGTDIAAVGDPATGFDIYDAGAPTQPGWITVGGTSLSSPVVAAMYALAGGSGGVTYPAATLYENRTQLASSFFDVVSGADGYCGGDSPTACAAAVSSGSLLGSKNNPNALGKGLLDCSFPATGNTVPVPAASSSECTATPGFDGASGLGTPSEIGAFAHARPAVRVVHSAATKTRVAFATYATEPIAGITPTSYAWNFGDGQTATSPVYAVYHTFAKAGAYTVTVTVTDSVGQRAAGSTQVRVGTLPAFHYVGPASIALGRTGSFSAQDVRSANTGARITDVTWIWGDGHSTHATTTTHKYRAKGTYVVTAQATDSTGEVASVRHTVKVT